MYCVPLLKSRPELVYHPEKPFSLHYSLGLVLNYSNYFTTNIIIKHVILIIKYITKARFEEASYSENMWLLPISVNYGTTVRVQITFYQISWPGTCIWKRILVTSIQLLLYSSCLVYGPGQNVCSDNLAWNQPAATVVAAQMLVDLDCLNSIS